MAAVCYLSKNQGLAFLEHFDRDHAEQRHIPDPAGLI